MAGASPAQRDRHKAVVVAAGNGWVRGFECNMGKETLLADFRKLTDDFYVAPQLAAADFAAARALGIRTVINNRPDGEAPEQLPDAEARAAAEAAGLTYLHVPVTSGGMTAQHIADFRAAVDAHGGPFLAFCRSGTRSCFLWAFAAVRELPVPDVVAAAAEAGYDLSPAVPALERTAG